MHSQPDGTVWGTQDSQLYLGLPGWSQTSVRRIIYLVPLRSPTNSPLPIDKD